MNNIISLPRLRSNSEFSKPLLSTERKKSFNHKKVEPIKDHKLQNDEQQNTNVKKEKLVEIKRAKSQIFKRRNVPSQSEQNKEKKYGLQENGKLSKITENSILSKGISLDRTKSSTIQHHDKLHTAALKKQLNEIISSILILKKEIKCIEGSTLVVKEQIKNVLQNTPQQNSQIQKKIEQTRKKTQNYKYDQQVLKNMKDRMKKTNIYHEKKAIDLKQTLEREERKIKILNQRSSIREESINKQKMIVKNVEQKERTIHRMNELAVHDYEKRLKELNSKKQMSEKTKATKFINQNEYHVEIYKKQEAKLFSQLRTNQFLQQMLDLRWHKYSEIYGNTEKAEKLMQMHSLQKKEEQFDPRKIFFGSFQIKKELQEKIKNKEIRLAECMKKNAELQKLWKNVQFKQIDEQENIIDKKSMQIKSGKIEEKDVIEKQERQFILTMRQKLQKSKKRAEKVSRIKDWILKLQNQLQLKPLKHSKIQERLLEVIQWTAKQCKQQKSIQKKIL